jgi:signal transduction histidine kinase/CheY-like chemotaxis protein
MTISETFTTRALILAPHGRDAAVATTLLSGSGIGSVVCRDLVMVAQALGDTTSFAILAEEAVRTTDLRPIAEWVKAQPSWSDLPFIILTHRDARPELNPATDRLSQALGNVTFLERPFHPKTFISVARSADNGRRRQYEVKALIEDLRHLNQTLDERVATRTAELERTHTLAMEEARQRERAEEQLRQSQKLEVVGQLTGGVAHDFNNLLMAVLGNLDLLRKHIPDSPTARRLLDGAVQGAKRGAALTQRLLAFARRQDLKPQPTDLVFLVRGMSDLLERSLGPRIEIRMELPGGLPPALVDAIQIELALLNLAVNARDAMPDGGVLSIEIDLAKPLAEDDLAPGSYVRVVITDTGHGMDSETLRRAVDPFFSTKEIGKGTGLGLSMVHGLAVQLKGTLRLYSEPGRGTRVELWLPSTPRAVQPTGASAPPSKTADEDPPRFSILLVDDDALIAMSTADMLADLGHEVIEAVSGEAAVEILHSNRRIDLLITDYSMPRMTGMQLAKAARVVRPELPILLATGYAELPQGAEVELPRLDKPYQQDQLAAEIAKAMNPNDSHTTRGEQYRARADGQY